MRARPFQVILHYASGDYPIEVYAARPTAAVNRALGILAGRIRNDRQGEEVRDTLQRITIIPYQEAK